MEYRTPSIRNARRILHWQPEVALQQTVAETLDFFLRGAVLEQSETQKDDYHV